MTIAELLSAAHETSLATLTGYLLIARTAGYFFMQGVLERNAHFNQKIVEADPSIPMGPLAAGRDIQRGAG